MPIIRCPVCRADVDIPSEWMGTEVRCGDCDQQFVATPPRARRPAADDDFDRPRRRRSEDFDDEDDRPRRRDDWDDDRPARRRPKPKKSHRTLVIVLSVVGLLVVGGCGGGMYWIVSAINAPIRFESAAWKEQPHPDGTCSVQLPITPRTETIPSPGNGVTGQKMIWEAAGVKDAAFVFGWMDAPPLLAGGFDEIYRAERDEIVRAVNGRVVRETPVTVHGYQGKEFEFSSGGATGVYRMIFIPGRAKHRVIMLMAGGRNMTAEDRTKFIESFRVKVRI